MNKPAEGACRAESQKTLQAIPTSYRGYRMRSRLEARWAVFFDHLGIDFWYEPEGFKLSGGEMYLPDFYLPRIDTYAEVKPTLLTTPEILKCEDLAHDSRRPVLLLEGPPDFRLYHIVCPYVTGNESILTDCLLDVDYHNRRYYDQERRLYSDIRTGLSKQDSAAIFTREEEFTERYADAVYQSRGQRFEGVA